VKPSPAPVEAALPPAVFEALHHVERLLGIPRGEWWRVPSLRAVLEGVAVAQVREEIEAAGTPRTRATRIAAIRLGLNDEAVERRLRRWRGEALK
jgi:hypothetical protein